ncbi:ScbR family autoregulator-binding transcription factor [Streptomyces sp. NPDC006552]|uniref:ScbR family autoregulator-binding transcription factor n=1 Tax=Streptomyces sp. NPDC006552 TaxID=3157179 RepID=UPI0033A5207A
MAKQDRAIRTRRVILAAAAKVFEARGFQAATINEILREAGVTKGALYFHFPSKEHLAQGVLLEQDQQGGVQDQACKVQEFIDTVMLHAYRLQTDPMVRAGVRLSLDQQAHGLDRSGPFVRWSQIVRKLLSEAYEQGELLPQVVVTETADVAVGAFAGVQAMSQAMCDHNDLLVRVSAMLRHLLPSVAHPSVLTTVEMGADRGEAVARSLEWSEPREPAEVS